jgi:hypothetical protein
MRCDVSSKGLGQPHYGALQVIATLHCFYFYLYLPKTGSWTHGDTKLCFSFLFSFLLTLTHTLSVSQFLSLSLSLSLSLTHTHTHTHTLFEML